MNLRRWTVTARAKLAGEGRVGPFLKTEKKCPDFGKRKDTYLSLGEIFFSCETCLLYIVDRSAVIPRNLACCGKWHGVKVRPGSQDPGPWDPEIQDPGLPSKFKSGTLIIIFLHCLTYFVLDKYIYIYNMEIIFHKWLVF